MKSFFVKLFFKGYAHCLTGIIVLLISMLSFYSTWEAMNIMKKGRIVEVIVLESPIDCKRVKSRTSFCKLKYKQRIFSKRTKGKKYCHLVSGKEKVLMHTNDDGNRILFPNEYNPIIFFYSFGMLVLSFWFFVKGIKKFKF